MVEMMRLRNGWYIADKGKHFVLTEKGKLRLQVSVIKQSENLQANMIRKQYTGVLKTAMKVKM